MLRLFAALVSLRVR
jgi:hypothetical protein